MKRTIAVGIGLGLGVMLIARGPAGAADPPAAGVKADARPLAQRLIEHPVLRPNGTLRLRVFLMDLASGVATPIVDEPVAGQFYCGSACWSGDGRRILFDSTPQTDWHLSHLWSLDLDNPPSKARDLGLGNCPSLSPDGRRIAFLSNAGGRAAWRQPHECGRHGPGPTRHLRAPQVVAGRQADPGQRLLHPLHAGPAGRRDEEGPPGAAAGQAVRPDPQLGRRRDGGGGDRRRRARRRRADRRLAAGQGRDRPEAGGRGAGRDRPRRPGGGGQGQGGPMDAGAPGPTSPRPARSITRAPGAASSSAPRPGARPCTRSWEGTPPRRGGWSPRASTRPSPTSPSRPTAATCSSIAITPTAAPADPPIRSWKLSPGRACNSYKESPWGRPSRARGPIWRDPGSNPDDSACAG